MGKKDILIAGFPETREIGKRVAKLVGGTYTNIFVCDFPDSEYHLELKKSPRGKTVVIINSITKEVDNKIIETILAGGIAKDYRAKKIILVATYLPYMRQDRHFEKYDSFSSKHVLELFWNFDRIIAIDPHLHRIKNLKELNKKAESITSVRVIADYIRKKYGRDFTIIGPDIESSQWSAKVAKMLGDGVVILKKHRYSATKVKQQEIRQKLKKNVIIIDDIISTGKTIIGALKIAREHGARKLIVIGVHGLFVNNVDKKIRKHAELVTTNTIPGKYAKIDVSSLIAERLKRI